MQLRGWDLKPRPFSLELSTLPLSDCIPKINKNISKCMKVIEHTSFCLQTDIKHPSISQGPGWVRTNMFRGESGIDKMLTDATRVVHYQVGGCIGDNICFWCEDTMAKKDADADFLLSIRISILIVWHTCNHLGKSEGSSRRSVVDVTKSAKFDLYTPRVKLINMTKAYYVWKTLLLSVIIYYKTVN